MRTAISRLLVLGLVAFGGFLIACSGGDDAPAQDAADPSSTAAATEGTSTSDEAGGTATPPGWVADALDRQESVRYIAATGGVGVSFRSACDDNARIDGSWPEGTELEAVLTGDANCADWTLMTDGDITSWVRDRYLSETAPATGSSGATASGSGSGTSTSARQVEVINFFGKLIPTAQLRVKPQTYSYVGTVMTAGCEASWHPVGDSAIALSGDVIADPAPDGCGYGAVSLTPAYFVTTN